jgi:hypothetical protein
MSYPTLPYPTLPPQATPHAVPTNAVFQTNDTVSFPGSVVLDPTAPQDQVFKLTYEGDGANRTLFLATSPDGLLWHKRDPETPIVPVRLFSDTQTALVAPGAGTPSPVWTALGRRDVTTDNDTAACAGAYPALRRVMAATSNGSAFGPYGAPFEVLTPGAPDVPVCLDSYNPAPLPPMHGLTFHLVSNFWHFSMNESGAEGEREVRGWLPLLGWLGGRVGGWPKSSCMLPLCARLCAPCGGWGWGWG